VVVVSLTPSSGLSNSGDCDEHAQGGDELKYVRDLNQFKLSTGEKRISVNEMKYEVDFKVCTD
jgi:hypothetical protein